MKLHNRSEIDRPAAHVWPFIVTSEHFRQWNDNIVDIEAEGEFRIG